MKETYHVETNHEKSACSFEVLYYSCLEKVGQKLLKQYCKKIKQNNKIFVNFEIKVS